MNMALRQTVFNGMRSREVHIVAGLLFFTAFSGTVLIAQNSAATTPPSLLQEGLVRSPNPINNTGNLLITGNIRGPAYFRGVVPYSAPTSFQQTLPSSSLDSFLRDSVGVGDSGRYNNYAAYNLGYRPYYSSTQTVANTMPGASVIAGAPTANISASSAQSYLSGALPARRDEVLDPTSAMSLARWRPMSMSPAEMQKLIDSEIARSSPAKVLGQQYQAPIEPFKSEPNQVSNTVEEFSKSTIGLNNPLLFYPEKKPDSNTPEVNQPFETLAQKQQEQQGEVKTGLPYPMSGELNLDKNRDVYDTIKWQLDKLRKELEQTATSQQVQETTVSAADQNEVKTAQEQTQQETSLAEKIAEADLAAARAKAIMGPFETFASFSEDKFNQNMRAAEMYLKQGRYYRAADAYTLASLYKPDDPLAYAGKSHALLGSGEYMSSALFLSRALRIFPDYAALKIDLVSMIGGRDTLESRVADIEEWLKRSGAPELQFLLAYVYHQMGRPQPAKEAINAAFEKMPDDPAVLALKKAIENSPPAGTDTNSLRITEGAIAK
jgi:tetratricopeptide (TPR) repeat protein